MRVLVTAGPTRQYIDSIRFITNPSTGRMGYAVASRALAAGHEVTLLTGPVAIEPPHGCEVVGFVTVADLAEALGRCFPLCDALIMAAAVGDFRPARRYEGKLSRRGGPIEITLVPTDDVLAGVASSKRADQTVVAFAVEDLPPDQAQAKAMEEMAAKHADYDVVNTVAAFGAERSLAAIVSPVGLVLPWAERSKDSLAGSIVSLLDGPIDK